MSRPKDMLGTRQQILNVAGLIFSQKGFRAATIADICRLAGTNIASVNYHFGDKQRLYVEAWREAFRRSHEKHPADGRVSGDAPAEERLRGWIVSLLNRVADPECYEFDIVHMEMTNPTGYLFEAIEEVVRPMRERLRAILREMLGEKATEQDVQLCEMSIHSQCMNPMIMGRRHKSPGRSGPMPIPSPLDADAKAIADHVIRFSFEGLPGVRRHIEARAAPVLKLGSAVG